MENKEFKKVFGDIAKANNYIYNFGGWYKESDECICVLSLQKSNFGNFNYLNIKIYIQNIFGKSYRIDKNKVKIEGGDVFRRIPNIYDDLLNLENFMNDDERRNGIERLFNDFLNSFVNKALTKKGIKELEIEGKLFLLPAVKEELEHRF